MSDHEIAAGGSSPEADIKAKTGTPSVSYSFIVRLHIRKIGGGLSKVLAAIAEAGGDTGSIDRPPTRNGDKNMVRRDITVDAANADHAEAIVAKIRTLEHVEVIGVSDRVFLAHLGGKLTVTPRREIANRDDLSMQYTPGVARVCMAVHRDPALAYKFTIKGSTVAVISDGSRVLSLGDIGAKAALPVMEGKAALFHKFGGINAFPITLDTQDTEEIIRTIKIIAPAFGAVNLEDIASPRCYEIEDRLRDELDIPVFHDDQHATAVVVTAAFLNAVKLTRKRIGTMKVVCCGVGAAGMACAKMLIAAGVKNLIGFNVDGAIYNGRPGLTAQEQWLAENSNPTGFTGTMQEALKGADMFLGLSVAGAIKPPDLAKMKKNAIVFALANPVPEVLPEEAEPYVRVMATGGSNYPNQINNALVFPGIFRGALQARVENITEEMKMEAARALAAVITHKELDDDYIIPSVFDQAAHDAVAAAVVRVAERNAQAKR